MTVYCGTTQQQLQSVFAANMYEACCLVVCVHIIDLISTTVLVNTALKWCCLVLWTSVSRVSASVLQRG